MIVKACDEIPEKERVALRGAVRTIDDIANHLLARFNVTDVKAFDDSNTVESLLVSATILQIITDKKFLYQNKHVCITSKIHENAQFAFIKVNQASFKRMLSNVLDNAAEATNSEDAKVLVLVDANIEWVNITVKDNGHGMSPEVIEKIMRGVPVTQGKDSGHGLGLSQVREFIQESAAQIDISSTKHQGTAVKLSFPKIMCDLVVSIDPQLLKVICVNIFRKFPASDIVIAIKMSVGSCLISFNVALESAITEDDIFNEFLCKQDGEILAGFGLCNLILRLADGDISLQKSSHQLCIDVRLAC